jgi:hypothetical protein
MKIADLKKKYKNKWVLAEVTKETKEHTVVSVEPILISDKRDEIYKSLAGLKRGAHVATFYTGEVPAKGMSFTFYVSIEI